MQSDVILSVVVVGREATPSGAAIQGLDSSLAGQGVEVLPIAAIPSPSHGHRDDNASCSNQISKSSLLVELRSALSQARGEWIVVLGRDENLLESSVDGLLAELRGSVPSLRHARVLLRNPERTAQEEIGGVPSCPHASMLRWWRVAEIPQPGALFIRRALLAHVLDRASSAERFNRYEIGVIASRGSHSVALPLCSTEGVFTPEGAALAERERIRATQSAIAELSRSEQAELWRDYYGWCAAGRGRQFTPIMLPQTRAQAQGLASMLGDCKRSMFEALWFVYRDIEQSKQAAVRLAKWGLLSQDDEPGQSTGDLYKGVAAHLLSELRRRRVESVVCVSEHLGKSPAPTLARFLRDAGEFGVAISAVSTRSNDDRRVVANLAQRGLLGWIRNVRSTSDTSDATAIVKLAGRALDEAQASIDCVTVSGDDPFLEREISFFAQRIPGPFQVVIYGQLSTESLSRARRAVERHKGCSLVSSEEGLVVLNCGEFAESGSPTVTQ